MTLTAAPRPLMRIEASHGWNAIRFRELWQYRELLFFLTWRDIKVRYKQTIMGASWAILQPVLTMVVFSIVFGRLAQLPSDGVPYPLFAYIALVPWVYFSTSLSGASGSLVGSKNLFTKVYFPRLIIPLSSVLTPLVDLVLASTVAAGLMAYYGIEPSWRILALPAFLLLACLTALGVGLWLSAVNVRYRDAQYVVPFLLQFWLFATPVAYSASLIPEKWQIVYALNPMAGVVEGIRWSILGTGAPGVTTLASVGVSLLVMITGAYYFRRTEKTFADVA